jgi:hypothetical protein
MDANTCPTCGSDCNERDELTKAEREITRLSAEVDALKRTHDEAMKRSHEVTQEMARQFETEVEALRADANALFGALARLHYAPWKLDSTDAEYREWSQAMHEASAAIQRHRDAAPAAPQQAEPAKPAPWPAEPDRRQPYLDLQSAWSCADQGTMAGSIIGRLVNELRILRERVDRTPVAAPQQAEPAIAIEVTQDADGTWSLTVPTYFPCMPVGKHDLYLHPPAAEVQRLRDALEDLLHHAETHRAEQVWVLRASEVADIARRALEGK